MGDISDDLLVQGLFQEMDGIDLYEPLEADDWNDRDEGDHLSSCKHCGQDNLFWEETPQGWRLIDDDTLEQHRCEEFFKQNG